MRVRVIRYDVGDSHITVALVPEDTYIQQQQIYDYLLNQLPREHDFLICKELDFKDSRFPNLPNYEVYSPYLALVTTLIEFLTGYEYIPHMVDHEHHELNDVVHGLLVSQVTDIDPTEAPFYSKGWQKK